MKTMHALPLCRCRMFVVVAMAVLSVAVVRGQETRDVKLEELLMKVPATWKSQKPSNNLRLGQFEIPPVEGDKEPAELTVFNFGSGGGVKANVDRWIEQFEAKNRESKTVKGKCPQGEYVLVETSGTYKKPIGPPVLGKSEPAPGYRMVGAIIAVEKKGNYFLKLTGPDKTVAANVAAFRAAIGASEKEETAWNEARD